MSKAETGAAQTKAPWYKRLWEWIDPLMLVLGIGTLAAFFCLGPLPWLMFARWYDPNDGSSDVRGIAAASALGDSFGVASAAMSALAVVGLVWTLKLQRQELRESREDRAAAARSEEEAAGRNLLAAYLHALESYTRILWMR